MTFRRSLSGYRRPIAIAAVIALAVAAIAVAVDYQRVRAHQLQLRSWAEASMNAMMTQLVQQLDTQMLEADTLSHLLTHEGAQSAGFTRRTADLFKRNPAVIGVALSQGDVLANLILPDKSIGDGRTRLSGRIDGLDLDGLAQRLQTSLTADRGVAFGQMDESVVFLVVPVEEETVSGGRLVLLIDLERMMAKAGINISTSQISLQETVGAGWMHVAIHHLDGSGKTRLTGADLSDLSPLVSAIPLAGSAFEVSAVPSDGWNALPQDQASFRLMLIPAGIALIVPMFIASLLVGERNRHIALLMSREANLTELSQRFNLAMETSNIGIWEVKDDNHLIWDGRAASLHGLTPESCESRLDEWLTAVHPDDINAAEAHFFTCICSSLPCTQTYRVRLADGTIRYLRSAGANYRSADGSTRTTGIVWDVSSDMMVNETLRHAKEDGDIKNAELQLALEELSRREQELEELSSRLDLALASNNCGIWETNQETAVEVWDARMCQLYNIPYTNGRMTREAWLSLVHPEDRALATEILPNFPRGIRETLTVRVPQADGSIRWVRSFGQGHEMRDGSKKIVGIAFDVTDDMRLTQKMQAARHEAEAKNIELEMALDELSNREQELEELTTRLNLALASYNCGIWESNPTSGTEVWDARMCQLYGVAYGDGVIPSAQWLEMIHPDDRQMARRISPKLPVSMKETLTVRVPQPDGSIRYVRSIGKAHVMREGQVKIVGIAFDVTEDVQMTQKLEAAKQEAEAKAMELETARQRIEHNALHDPLTALANRRKLDLELDALSADNQGKRTQASILHLDLDRFKQINDTLGHAAGDAMLIHTAQILRRNVPANALVARIGGDEFVILLNSLSDQSEVAELANRIISEVRQPMDFEGFSCRCGVSIGIAQANGSHVDARRMLVNADIALYRAKAKGRNCYEFFTQDLQAEIITQKRTADEILSGIENGEFITWYQPQFCADTRELVGVEALVRWQHPYRGLVTPDFFLPIAEELNVSAVLDQMVLEQVLKDQMRWAASGITVPRVSVNVSSKRLRDENLVSTLETLAISPGQIAFELVESIFLDESDDLVTYNLERIKALGIDIEIDDFGTGHTSIVSLLKLKPKRLKIDRQLVMPILSAPQERSLVRSIIEIAKSLGVETVAEGVETMEHAAMLRSLGCDMLQGYAFARPIPFAEFSARARSGFSRVA
ncbi:EAL domain-containing protein [Rhizobium sp. SSA_523]|uniref:sensor domain-containing protein n=1 Tax=Rhizobium sp. SSA_523 TaxID=2952477 RepID=UPI002091E412|nr:EAL domain-containing protein [Rhizobium sp. SSA_523]MCO5731068.1 EAL domain-containing protein [Rhizobium sp. SSA_523]WKC24131.1 EAL domain-containing protein [Rhizobium sp. SSA_523]